MTIKYESAYEGGSISPSQRLTEIICEKIARGKGITLSPRFWNDPFWEKVFKLQIVMANRLIKAFSYEAVFRALQKPGAKRLTSLGAPFFKPLVEYEQKVLDSEQKSLEASVTPQSNRVDEKPRPPLKSKKISLREKLDG